jgi:uncharacterized membrane protein YdjX (TVP38/TMEM64 family)
MPPALSAERKKLLLKVAAAAVLLIVAGVLALRGFDVIGFAERALGRGIGILQAAGPWAFFIAMALLPAVGAPLSAFTLTAGRAFGSQMGMGWVIAAAFAAIAVNILLTYWLARRILRPLISRIVTRLGYRLPELDKADLTDLIVILRVTPGPPFCAQNYLLGLADAPFVRYMAISCAVMWTYAAAAIVFGDALLSGRARVAIFAIGILAALAAAAHLLRHHLGRRRESA